MLGSIPAGNAEDANNAVRAAREAFGSWSTTSVPERAGYLKKAAEGLQLRQSEIAMLVSQEVGMPFAYSNVIQVGLPVQSFVSIADVALAFPFELQPQAPDLPGDDRGRPAYFLVSLPSNLQ